jgi:hypothetical protein
MGYALCHQKLWSVHLNDQNGPKVDEDRTRLEELRAARRYEELEYLIVSRLMGKG